MLTRKTGFAILGGAGSMRCAEAYRGKTKQGKKRKAGIFHAG
jgi:hypothetical protein